MDRSFRSSQSPNRFSKLRSSDHSYESHNGRNSHDSQPPSPLGKYFEFATGSDDECSKSQDSGALNNSTASFKLSMRFPAMGHSDSLRSSASSTGPYSSHEGRGFETIQTAGMNGSAEYGLGNSGVGLYFRPDSNGQFFVEGVIPMSSAHRCGLIQRGDELLAVSIPPPPSALQEFLFASILLITKEDLFMPLSPAGGRGRTTLLRSAGARCERAAEQDPWQAGVLRFAQVSARGGRLLRRGPNAGIAGIHRGASPQPCLPPPSPPSHPVSISSPTQILLACRPSHGSNRRPPRRPPQPAERPWRALTLRRARR